MTVGAEVDAELALVKARLAALEATGKADWVKVKAYIAANLPHVVTWAGLIYGAVKTGLVKLV